MSAFCNFNHAPLWSAAGLPQGHHLLFTPTASCCMLFYIGWYCRLLRQPSSLSTTARGPGVARNHDSDGVHRPIACLLMTHDDDANIDKDAAADTTVQAGSAHSMHNLGGAAAAVRAAAVATAQPPCQAKGGKSAARDQSSRARRQRGSSSEVRSPEPCGARQLWLVPCNNLRSAVLRSARWLLAVADCSVPRCRSSSGRRGD